MTSPKSPTPLSSRTKMITVASIGAVGLASLFAIGANLGILARADKSTIGTMSAAVDVVTPTTPVVGVGLDQQTDPLGSPATAVGGAQHFTVDRAGTVDVSVANGTARISLASPADGWTAKPAARPGVDAAVVFTDGTRMLEFTAIAGPDGRVIGDLTESTAEAPATPSGHHDDDDHGSDHHDSHDHDGSHDDD